MPNSQKTPIQEALDQIDANLNDYAIKNQAMRFQEIYENFNKDTKRLQQKLGQAYGNADAIAAIQQEYADLVAKRDADLAAANDIEQFKEGFNNDKYVRNKDSQITKNKVVAKVNDVKDKAVDAIKEHSGSALADSIDSVSGDISNALSGYLQAKAFGATPHAPNSEYIRNQARMHDLQAADEQKNAARNNQIANRNYRVEAEKEAAAGAAAENAQKVNNMGNASAGAAALERSVKAADYGTHMQRQDEQRKEGARNQRNMWAARQAAEYERSGAVTEDNDYQERNLYNSLSDYLSKGGFGTETDSTSNTQQPAQQPEPQPTQQPVQQPEPQQPQQTSLGTGTLQNIYNYALGSDLRRTHNGTAAKRWRVSNGNITEDAQQNEMQDKVDFPEYTQAMEQDVINTYNSNEKYHKQPDETPEEYIQRLEAERGMNMGDPGWANAAAKEIQEQPTQQATQQTQQTQQATMSDFRQKNIIAAVNSRF